MDSPPYQFFPCNFNKRRGISPQNFLNQDHHPIVIFLVKQELINFAHMNTSTQYFVLTNKVLLVTSGAEIMMSKFYCEIHFFKEGLE